jgi:hypothetical protein
LSADLAALSTRVARLEAERAIIDTLSRYGHSIDYGDEAMWLDCFAPAAKLELRLPGPDGARMLSTGHAELTAFFAAHTHSPDFWHKHVLVEPIITIDDAAGTASGRSYMMRVDHWHGDRAITAFGRYVDRLVRCDDGGWRISERIVEIESLDPGLGRPT